MYFRSFFISIIVLFVSHFFYGMDLSERDNPNRLLNKKRPSLLNEVELLEQSHSHIEAASPPDPRRIKRTEKVRKLSDAIVASATKKEFDFRAAQVAKMYYKYRSLLKKNDFIQSDAKPENGQKILFTYLVQSLYKKSAEKRWKIQTTILNSRFCKGYLSDETDIGYETEEEKKAPDNSPASVNSPGLQPCDVLSPSLHPPIEKNLQYPLIGKSNLAGLQ
ncbi:hypothetical protein HYV11_01615 [Candidatus Dependentiae bacterium]|nr:hypothetical protein [Candidatus Dependentiae bacterium]